MTVQRPTHAQMKTIVEELGMHMSDARVQEFLDVMAAMGDESFDDLEPAKQRAIEDRYFELLEDPTVQGRHEGELQPAMGYEDMASEVRALRREIEMLKGGQRPVNMA